MLPNEFPDHLPRSPLTLVIGQVRFSSILDIHDMLGPIQHQFRAMGLPGFDKQRIQQLSVGTQIGTDEVRRYVFSDKHNKQCLFLTENFVVLADSAHERFKKFSDRFTELLKVVFEIAKPDHVQQIGLRYVNILRDLDEVSSNDMIVAQLRGLSPEGLETQATRSSATTQAKTGVGQLNIRSMQLKGPGFLPPDLQVDELDFSNRPAEGEEFRLLDIDHVCTDKPIERDDTMKRMNDLHYFTRLAFLRSVTDDAIRLWSTE